MDLGNPTFFCYDFGSGKRESGGIKPRNQGTFARFARGAGDALGGAWVQRSREVPEPVKPGSYSKCFQCSDKICVTLYVRTEAQIGKQVRRAKGSLTEMGASVISKGVRLLALVWRIVASASPHRWPNE